MIERLLLARRERALEEWVYQQKTAWLLAPTPLGGHADTEAARARRRLNRADRMLDLWTYRQRARARRRDRMGSNA